jgi:hypothetical protein
MKTKPFQIRWKEPLGKPECPYMYRWVFLFFNYSIRIHHWIRSDDKRYYHDHPWWFITFVVKGCYTDVSEGKSGVYIDTLKRWDLVYRKSKHAHYVLVPPEGCWTVMVTGKPVRKWGFWIGNRFFRPLRYFNKYGHPPCSEQ